MELTTKFDESNFNNILIYAKTFAGIDYSKSLEVVINAAFSDLRNLPKLSYPKKVGGTIQPVPLKEYVGKWVDKYLKGYKGRPSQKIGKKSKTFSDPIMKLSLSYRLSSLSANDLEMLEEGHSALMSIENLVGEMLEEYLSIKLLANGWYCCWGSSIDAVDFCNITGELLQVKNSDNSENSSSSRVRNGTTIKKWSRRNSTKKDTFRWDVLLLLTGATGLTEKDFRAHVKNTLTNNPNSLFIDTANNKHLK